MKRAARTKEYVRERPHSPEHVHASTSHAHAATHTHTTTHTATSRRIHARRTTRGRIIGGGKIEEPAAGRLFFLGGSLLLPERCL